MNHIVVDGHAGKDGEIRSVGGNDLGTFSIAHSVYRGPDKDEDTIWFTINLWGSRSKVANMVSKGDRVVISGRLRQDEWEKDGETRTSLVIDVNEITLPKQGGGSSSGSSTKKSTPRRKKKKDPDLPF